MTLNFGELERRPHVDIGGCISHTQQEQRLETTNPILEELHD
jgi:hypothetical protein